MNTKKRPKNGYDFEEKQKYRTSVWNSISKLLKDKIPSSKILFLPSQEGLEIPLALSLGFREENLYAVEEDTQLLNEAHWKVQYPLIKIYNMKVNEAIKIIQKEDNLELNAIILDFCNNISIPLLKEISEIFKNLKMKECLFSITLLKGRENSSMISFLKTHTDINLNLPADRIKFIIDFICEQFKNGYKEIIKDEYTSNRKMVYGVYSLLNMNDYAKKYIEKYENLRSAINNIFALDNKITDGAYIDKSLSKKYNLNPSFKSYEIAYKYLFKLQSELSSKRYDLRMKLFEIEHEDCQNSHTFDHNELSRTKLRLDKNNILRLIYQCLNLPDRRLDCYIRRF